MESLESLVERYVDCYNRVDVEGMLECVTDDVEFENISNSGQSMQLQGSCKLLLAMCHRSPSVLHTAFPSFRMA